VALAAKPLSALWSMQEQTCGRRNISASLREPRPRALMASRGEGSPQRLKRLANSANTG
jgi:hypothetical protein